MIYMIHNLVGMGFKKFEVYSHSDRIKFMGPDSDGDPPVMSMRVFATAWIITKIMTTWKMRFNGNIVD